MKKKKTIKKLLLSLLRKTLRGIRWIYRRLRTLYRLNRSAYRNHRIAYPSAGLATAAVIAVIFMLSAPASDAGQEKTRRIIYKIYTPVHDVDELETDTVSIWEHPLPDMPGNCIPMKRSRFPASYHKMFNDSNYIHWDDAEKIGIDPMSDTRSHWQLRRPLVKMTSCQDFYIEPLKYSRPYLVPEGAAMLHEIGRRFRDTLRARGGGDYRIKVTSLLRTPSGVARLRRRNRNAVDSSVHQLGTTVDISYSRFIADSDSVPRSAEDLKAVLAEVLLAMRREGKCWVKHEHNQPCFHISARPAGSPPPQE